jgi:thiamine-monophosphate kinase
MTNCVLAPPDMTVEDLDRYFAGFGDAIETFGFLHGGGDVSSADAFRSVCTAVGTVPCGQALGRDGCRPGDYLACIGTCGNFAISFLKALRFSRAELSQEDQWALIRPMPRLAEVRSLRSVATLSAASDASDGLLAAVWNIAQRSQCAFSLVLEEAMLIEELRGEAEAFALDPWTLFAFWGDWQVVVTYPPSEKSKVVSLAESMAIPFIQLGRAVPGVPQIRASIGGSQFHVRPFGNQHFTPKSYLFADRDDVISMMRQPVLEAA